MPKISASSLLGVALFVVIALAGFVCCADVSRATSLPPARYVWESNARPSRSVPVGNYSGYRQSAEQAKVYADAAKRAKVASEGIYPTRSSIFVSTLTINAY